MLETLKLALSHFQDETLTLVLLLLFFCFSLFLIVWFQNRKKYHQLAHHIPAGLLKNYLDTVIENSHALKSSLLRGGGEGLTPLSGMMKVDSSQMDLIGPKNAELAQLRSLLSEKEKMTKDLEEQLNRLREQMNSLSTANASASPTTSSPDQDLLLKQAQEVLAKTEQENKKLFTESEDLKLKLKEYEIIEDDLANLKKLQTENDQLKQELALLKNSDPSSPQTNIAPVQEIVQEALAPVPEAPLAPQAEVEPVPQETASPDLVAPVVDSELPAGIEGVPDTGMEEMMAALEEQKKAEGSASADAAQSSTTEQKEEPSSNTPEKKQEKSQDKTADELLMEFEKMLE